jgi:hypothetical protein
MVVAVLFVVGFMLIICGILVIVFFTDLPRWIQGGFLSVTFAGESVFLVVRYALFWRWERKIVQGFLSLLNQALTTPLIRMRLPKKVALELEPYNVYRGCLENMNTKKRLANFIRGWLPKEPALPRKQKQISQNNENVKKPKYKSHSFQRGIIFCIFYILTGLMHLFSKRYDFAILGFACAIIAIPVAYFGWTVRPRTALGVFLIGLGFAVFFYYDFAVFLFGSLPVFASLLIYLVSILWFPALLVTTFVAYAIWIRRSQIRNNLNERHLLPYGASAAFIFLTYIAIISGIEFAYAIPLTFIISGILVLKGLRRFTVTIPPHLQCYSSPYCSLALPSQECTR